MIILRTLLLTAFVGVLSGAQVSGERWSRQISNSEWIPLANPRNNQKSQTPLSVAPAVPPAAPVQADSSAQAAAQTAQAIALPPALQQQYQDQLLQLQKTQESIQKLLMLQQQLKAQQHLLQSHAYQPNGFTGPEDEKQAIHQSTIVNLQTLPELAPEVLVPPVPSSEALPPVFRAQNFRPAGVLKSENGGPFLATSPIVGEQDYRQESITRPTTNKDYSAKQKSRYENGPRLKEEPSHVNFVTPPTSAEEQEEIQLVYVPAETLAQRGQAKLQRPQHVRKHNGNRHYHPEDISSSPVPSQEAYAREVLHQLQRQHEVDSQFLKSERQKEAHQLNVEQKDAEREAQLQDELTRREQELMRQREAERKRKELEKIEEAARRRNLIRQQELRDKEYKAKQNEIKQKELEKLAALEKDKELKREADEGRLRAEPTHHRDVIENYQYEQSQAQPLTHEAHFHQHLTEVTSKNLKNGGNRNRNKPRAKLQHYQQQDFPEQEAQPTTPTPNQPPLSVYMGDSLSNHHRIRLADVLKSLKNAKSIAVLDNFAGADTPKVFVGPRHLDPPAGYAKFDLPYLSSIENNRVERKVDKLPFFVAPLSFEPPQGYSKIPFPAPHIGSVVINSLENVEIKPLDGLNPSPNPLIEPNSYVVSNQASPAYDVTPVSYAQPTTPRYEISSAFPSQSSTKWRFNDLYENKPSTEIPATVTASSYHDDRFSTNKYDRPTKARNYYNPNEVSSTPSYYSPKTITAFSFEQSVPQSTPAYRAETTRQHTVQPHFVNANTGNFHQTVSRFPDPLIHQEKNHRYPIDPTGHAVTHPYFVNQSPSLEEQTRYNLPAELPAISPQLPGLVNALVEKAELSSLAQLPLTTPLTTTTTTTTEPPTTTTYRARTRPSRNRVTGARSSTTLSPPSRGNSERTRRPVNRSRSKYTTTTEDYHDSSYDPTRRSAVTPSRYDDQGNHVRRPTGRPQNYKPRDEETKESIQTQIVDSNAPSEQGQRAGNAYDNPPLIDPASSSASAEGSLRPNDGLAPTSNLNIPYQQDDYSASTASPSSPAEAPQRHSSISDSLLPLAGLEYTRKTTQAPPSYSSTVRTLGEEQPINGFNYRTHEIKSSVQPTRDYPFFRPGKTESVRFEPIASTGLPNVQRSQLENFSPVYHAVSGQDQYEKNETPRPVYHNPSSISGEDEQPIFLPIPQNKEEYEYQTTLIEGLTETTPEPTTIPTTTPTTTTTTTTTTTEAPVIIRQRVRARLSGRPAHQDSVIQTRPRGRDDEYVRFSAVNQEGSGRTRQRTRAPSRSRVQQQQQHNSPIQTEGQEYVRIQSAPAQTRRPTTTTTTKAPVTEERPAAPAAEEDYGFVKSTNHKVLQANHKTTQSQSVESSESTSTEAISTQAPLLKHRQKYFSASRRPSGPGSRATTPSSSEDQTYTVRSRGRPSHSSEEAKPTKPRSRLRRPSSTRRRVSTTTTSTTEAALEANNELPIDENYPRIGNQRPQELQGDLYNEKNRELYDRPSPQSGKRREHDLTEENYPQEFLLNYGASQSFHRDDYDQAQLASRQQPSSAASTRPRLASRPTADIYGAESQWSTKLTGNSFQPSSFTPNQPAEEGLHKPLVSVGREKAGDFPEIITIGPDDDMSAVTVLVSSDLGESSSDERKVEPSSSSEESSIVNSMVNSMVDFGKKMNADEVEGLTAPPETTVQATTASTTEYVQPSTKPAPAEVSKPGGPTFKKAGLKRRRVRVRVRPSGSTPDDFVTAESQSYDSSLNNLPHEPSKFRNFYLTTESPASSSSYATTTTTTTTAAPETEKSIFESFLDKMLGGPEEAPSTVVPEMITITANPEESYTNPATTFVAAETTLREGAGNSNPEQTTTLRNRDEEVGNTELPASAATTTLIDSAEAHSTTSAATEKASTTTTTSPTSTTTTTTTTTTEKIEDIKSNSGENVIQSLNQDNSLRYFATKSPAFSEYLRSQEKSRLAEQNPAYPKNHRSKWSEVRYPSDKGLFEFGKWSARNNQSSSSSQESSEQNSAESSSDSSVTDYVKAIFESIKSADEDHHQKAKLADEEEPTPKTSGGRKEKDLPTEIKTSVSSSSRVISSSASQESVVSSTSKPTATFGPFVPSMMSDRLPGVLVKKTPLELNLGKILKTTTTTKVTQQTEICYRGRCVMSKPKKDGLTR